MQSTSLPADEARGALYRIIRGDAPFDEKARQALQLGRRYLGADNAHLTAIDRETDHWEALVSTDSADGTIPPGLKLDLDTTYCRRTIESTGPITLWNAPDQGWGDDPAYLEHGLSCYHGTTLVLDDRSYGTVCFVSEEARDEPFDESETMFAELITRMLERELEHEQHESQLTRQTAIANVLNRVLRHNIRNDMAIIRGYTQLLKDDNGDSGFADLALEEIDELLALSEKARELERVVGESAKRQPMDVGALVDGVVTDRHEDHPDATVHMAIDDAVSVAVFPTVERAIEELIENAFKHTGTSPTIEVCVERVPNAVEISISDDGPGLSEQDQTVVSTGEETPLIHGSGLGLWMVHWIVTGHGGTADAQVTEDGTTVSITLPTDVPTMDQTEAIADFQRARDRYEAAFEESMDAMVLLNDDAKVLDANTEAAAILGLDRRQLLGRSVEEFTPADYDFQAAWNAFRDTGAIDTVEINGADGEPRMVEYTANPDIIPGQHFVVYRDLSHRASG